MARPRSPLPVGDPAAFVAQLPPAAELPVLDIPATTPPAVREGLLDALAQEGSREPAVVAVAGALRERAKIRRRHEPGERELLEELLEGLHELVEYRADPANQEQFNRALRTLQPARGKRSPLTGRPRGQGDCEDLAVLFCAFARALGLEARPVWLDQPGQRLNHVAAVACGPHLGVEIAPAGCAWVETTLPGARIGEHPWAAAGRLEHGAERVYGAAGELATCQSPEEALLAGVEGAGLVVARNTALRAAILAPGIAVAGRLVGVRGWLTVAALALGGSLAVEVGALALAASRRREVQT